MAYNLLFVSENERDQIKRDLTLRKLFFKWFAQAKKSTHRETETQYANSHTIVAHFRLFESRFSVAVVRLLVFFLLPSVRLIFRFWFFLCNVTIGHMIECEYAFTIRVPHHICILLGKIAMIEIDLVDFSSDLWVVEIRIPFSYQICNPFGA